MRGNLVLRQMVLPVLLVVTTPTRAGVESTVHNLSVSGPGDVTALSEDRICVFCHAPHRSTTRAPLWNRNDSRASYLLYDTSTLDALPGQPTGESRVCLSCHDGTVALGEIVSEPGGIEFPPAHTNLDPSTGSLETDLADDHPVSFTYDSALVAADAELKDPASITPPVHLDDASRMQCTSCHDPHDNSHGNFLLKSDWRGGLCLSCHEKTRWNSCWHKKSSATWNGVQPDPWPDSDDLTVGDNACRNCHDLHTAAQPSWLVKGVEEEVCLVCHNGNVARDDVDAEFAQTHRHPLDLSQGIHEAAEDPLTAPRHVECTDCHNPHQVNHKANTSPPDATGNLYGVDGIDMHGFSVAEVQYEYEVCFKCHGDSTSANQEIPRTAGEINTRLEFASNAISFHPVTQPGKNPDVPSLKGPVDETSLIYCRTCHSSDLTDSQSWNGGGPHGSQYRFLLRRNYETADYTQENETAYALCYFCHNRAVIIGKFPSGFLEHKKHVVGEDSPCSACHDPHGISAAVGTTKGNSHLISFDTTIVSPNKNGELRYEDRGYRAGSCWLECHGEDHDDEAYSN